MNRRMTAIVILLTFGLLYFSAMAGLFAVIGHTHMMTCSVIQNGTIQYFKGGNALIRSDFGQDMARNLEDHV